MKLLTYLQKAKWWSRRTITKLIQEQRIYCNGQQVESFTTQVQSGDLLTIDGASITVSPSAIETQTPQLILFHKPCGYVVSKQDPHNVTIFALLPEWWCNQYYPIGRLDKESSGLLLLTDTPKIVHDLLHPSKKLKKIYLVHIKQPRQSSHTSIVNRWCTVSEQGTLPQGWEKSDLLRFEEIQANTHQDWWTLLTITLYEWKKRHIRRLLAYLGYTILSLHRTTIGPRTVDSIEPGKRTALPYQHTLL